MFEFSFCSIISLIVNIFFKPKFSKKYSLVCNSFDIGSFGFAGESIIEKIWSGRRLFESKKIKIKYSTFYTHYPDISNEIFSREKFPLSEQSDGTKNITVWQVLNI